MAYCMLNHGHVPSCKMMLKGELKSKNIYWLSNWPYDKRELSCFNCPRSARKDPWRPAGESFEERALKAMNWDANKVTSRIFGIKNLKCQSMCLFFKFRQGFLKAQQIYVAILILSSWHNWVSFFWGRTTVCEMNGMIAYDCHSWLLAPKFPSLKTWRLEMEIRWCDWSLQVLRVQGFRKDSFLLVIMHPC